MRHLTITSYEAEYRCNMMREDGRIMRVGNILAIQQGDQVAYCWFTDPIFQIFLDASRVTESDLINWETWPELRRPDEFFGGMCKVAETEGLDQFLSLYSTLSALIIYKDKEYHV
ncbi:hypothetical protein HOU00_gp370 [Caulobacter phage CcrPW]|uniref:Uncharacterized protein n=1 Tax=Caulobacter phage CcrPW TaxID=2283271 RepID=A0A385ECM2_9CAUD|nr:hypothetical protein HOU00_gp370 [Caulobacter phage CcrPW]AXQ68755.1 hypothetical protein CcrPW_gp216c [Caulobacter phage CcrPW]